MTFKHLNTVSFYTQKHSFVADRVGHYGNQYIISGYRILWFLCARYDVTPPNI